MRLRLLRRRPCPYLAQLGDCRAQLHVSERARIVLKGQLAHWIDQAIRARAERDTAERERQEAQACLLVALQERDDAYRAGMVQADEVRLLQRSQEDLTVIADGLRDELRELRAGLAVGALTKKGRH